MKAYRKVYGNIEVMFSRKLYFALCLYVTSFVLSTVVEIVSDIWLETLLRNIFFILMSREYTKVLNFPTRFMNFFFFGMVDIVTTWI
jgi:hypothetical protein